MKRHCLISYSRWRRINNEQHLRRVGQFLDRYAFLESVEKALNDRDIDEDTLGLEETESNQNHPLLSDLLHDARDRDFEPHTGSLRTTDGAVAETAPSAAVPCTGRQPAQVIRGRGGRGKGGHEGKHQKKGAWPGFIVFRVGVFTIL